MTVLLNSDFSLNSCSISKLNLENAAFKLESFVMGSLLKKTGSDQGQNGKDDKLQPYRSGFSNFVTWGGIFTGLKPNLVS